METALPAAEATETTPAQNVKLTRGSVACRRCRRLRSKCVHGTKEPPCEACIAAGPEAVQACEFPRRGEDSSDREFRRKRVKMSDERTSRSISTFSTPSARPTLSVAPTGIPADLWDWLPPMDELVAGVKVFSSHYFQLGFLPRALFLERLAEQRESISVFLLLAILSISARFTPALVRRYDGALKATDYFMQRAAILVPQELYTPSLERCQAFFLLGIADWGNGERHRSFIHLGVAVRMAGLLRLHLETTYQPSLTATPDDIIQSEVARRTFWMLNSQDDLHSGNLTPASFVLADVTALLPSDEIDFAFGREPTSRAALAGTRAALTNPLLATLPDRSLFATLVQAHNLWGQVARCACRNERELAGATAGPWDQTGEFVRLSQALSDWEGHLPPQHQWSKSTLRGHKAQSLDLAYLSVTMVLRLSNIVMRRIYLPCIAAGLDLLSLGDSALIGTVVGAPPHFWEAMSMELFTNVFALSEQIEASFPHQGRDEGFPAILIFCVYICGSLASYLWKWPQLCPHLAAGAEGTLKKCLDVLSDLKHAWPASIKWEESLRQANEDFGGALEAEASKERSLDVTHGLYRDSEPRSAEPSPTALPPAYNPHSPALLGLRNDSHSPSNAHQPPLVTGHTPDLLYQLAETAAASTTSTTAPPPADIATPSNFFFTFGASFETELSEFLQGDMGGFPAIDWDLA